MNRTRCSASLMIQEQPFTVVGIWEKAPAVEGRTATINYDVALDILGDAVFMQIADTKSGDEILGLMRTLNEAGQTFIIVTHDPHVAERTDQTIFTNTRLRRPPSNSP